MSHHGKFGDLNGHTNGDSINESNYVDGTTVDGLKVLIAGAGIGGLTAAIYLRRAGHKVTVFEQSAFANELGAAVQLAPNTNGVLRHVGINAEEFGAVETKSIVEYDASGKLLRSLSTAGFDQIFQHKWLLCHRVHLHEHLMRRATAPTDLDNPGTPVEVQTSSRVAEVDTHTATVTLESGQTFQGHVVVGADGVHSRTRKKVPGGDVKVFGSGKSAYRFLVNRKAALEDPRTKKYADQLGQLAMCYDRDRRVVIYPCANNEQLNFVCIHPTEESGAKKEAGAEYNQVGHKSKLLEIYKSFDPDLIALLDKAQEETLKVWELLDLPPLEAWTNEKLALLGDAAHPFLPHQGQGAGQAIEDAAALGAVLPKGTKPEEVPQRLQLYFNFRYERATNIQSFSRELGKDQTGKEINMQAHMEYNFGYDEWDSATDKFRRWQWAQNPNLYWRMPIAFGPMPGPRQDFYGRPHKATHSTATTASIKIKTSRTVLQSLFPTTQFRFRSPGTIAYCSFSQTTLDKMDWLGGGGYRHFGLYVHGVQYVKKDGSVIDGTYMPLLFESLADPIVSGREELGMPKLYCAIDIHRRHNSYRLQTSWQGATFGELALEDLQEVDVGAEKGAIGGEADDGIIVYRYIPQVHNRGQAAEEYAVFVPHAEEGKVVPTTVKRIWKAGRASVKFDPKDWDALPTLHHVIDRLAEIPVYEVVGAKVVESEGVPDVSNAIRVDEGVVLKG
ncbi:uncharacterized protein IWZ02DRAFT_430968 [Phyllosticta citriasiana]|uniref:FAD-binding domain-containing protein n=1 Tax=Phyllosticta citriasiana TaxID=595635 RepID=A0ABR1KJU9_9PEZI